MQMGIASDLAAIQSGTPAQYSQPSYAPTMPQGQMPMGMTGVLASERGQQMPQPQLFGENILQGNVDFNREMVSPAVQGREPSYTEMLAIGLKHAMLTKNQDEIFKYAKAIQETEKQATKYGMNPTKGINEKGQPDYFVVNELGQKQFLGVAPYETPKEAKTSLVKTSKGFEVVRDGELPRGAPIEAQTQPRQPRLQQVTDATGTYIVDLDTGETRAILVNGKPVAKPPQAPSGEESNAAGFLVRMKDATKLLDTFEEKGKPSVLTSSVSGVPLVGGYLERNAQTKEQQQYKNAALAWIRAKLRKESGAAIGADEARQEYENYFPVVGDTPEVIAQKRSLRQSAMDEMRLATGKAAIKADEVRPTTPTVNATVTPQTKIVKTRADLNKVKSGESYIAPDGKLWVKP